MRKTTEALSRFNLRLAMATRPAVAFDALDHLIQGLLPCKLVTVSTVVDAGRRLQRSYTNHPEAWPLSGIVSMGPNRWTETVLDRRESFIAPDLVTIEEVFPEHELIASLALGSAVSLPILLGRDLIAVLTLLEAEGYFTPSRVKLIHDHMILPAMAAQLAFDRLGARG